MPVIPKGSSKLKKLPQLPRSHARLAMAYHCGPWQLLARMGLAKITSLLEAMAMGNLGTKPGRPPMKMSFTRGNSKPRSPLCLPRGDQIYRIIRSRHRLQGSRLEFQVQAEAGYRVLTQRGVRATQQLICHHLKLDYETFINSAYLRQGRLRRFYAQAPQRTETNFDRFAQT